MPPVTLALILLNVAVFMAESMLGDALILNFALWPFHTGPARGPAFQLWQVVSYSFLHANFWHLFVNMYAVYMFGGDLERVWGPRRYLALYFASVVAAAFAQLVWSGMAQTPPYPTVGASGGVFGLLLAFAMYFPRRVIVLLIPPVPLPAWLFVTLYGILTLYLGISGTQAGIAHFAHLGGMLGALLLIFYWRSPRGRIR